MLRNYLTLARRNLLKHWGSSAINIIGLAVGAACCLLIVEYVRHEWSYDRFHEKADRIYRAWVLEDYGENQRFFNAVTPIPLGPALGSHLPEIQETVRVSTFTSRVQKESISFDETIHMVDPAFFEVFDFPLRSGDPAPLRTANAVVLTPETALRYWGAEDPVGQTLSIHIGETMQDFMVTGVTEEVPGTSSISFSLLVSWAQSTNLFDDRQRRSWGSVIPETYVLLREGVAAADVEAKLPTLVEQMVGGGMRGGTYTIGLQPLTAIHLDPDFPRGIAAVSDPAYSYILSVLALLVLGIACINVVTLSMARSTGRALEVGVRKVMGAERVQLMQQFWGEAGVLMVLALLGGVLLAWLSLPFFNDLAGTRFTLRLDAEMLLFIAALAVLLGWVAGSYPALVLSRSRPVEVLKGALPLRKGGFGKGLIVAQFAFAVFLISSALIMSRQLHFLQTKNLGFDQEQVVVIPLQGILQSGMRGGMSRMSQRIETGMELSERFKQTLSQQPTIKQVAAASFMPGTSNWFKLGYYDDNGRFLNFQMNVIDPDFVETLGMELVAGRNFAGYGTADASRGIIINETLAASYGWDEPVGQRLPGPFGDHEIIGVVRDFHFQSLHMDIAPVVLAMNIEPIMAGISDINVTASPMPKLFVRLAPGAPSRALSRLEAVWNRLAAGQPFEYSFLDERIDSQYRAEERLRRLVVVATVLAIFIACMGLFALAALTVTRRTKEIGLRKVMGASVPGIVLLLTREFAALVLVAYVLATPVVYFVMHRWLDNFAYRIGMGPGVFFLAGVVALTIALLTVSYQSIRAALSNPVDSLRYE